MSEPEPTTLTGAVDEAIAEAEAEIVALEACLVEQREHLDELLAQRENLKRLERAGPLTGARVRDAVRKLAVFTMSELVAELDKPPNEVRRFLHPLIVGGLVESVGVARGRRYEYVPPDMPGPREHPTRRPPEKEPPAGLESRATGEPVRVAAAEKVTRRGRSTPGVAMKVKNRDRNYERQEAAKQERIEAQKSKAQKEPKWKKRK